MGPEEVAVHDVGEGGGGGCLSVVKPFSLGNSYSVASLSHLNMYR